LNKNAKIRQNLSEKFIAPIIKQHCFKHGKSIVLVVAIFPNLSNFKNFFCWKKILNRQWNWNSDAPEIFSLFWIFSILSQFPILWSVRNVLFLRKLQILQHYGFRPVLISKNKYSIYNSDEKMNHVAIKFLSKQSFWKFSTFF